MATKWRERIYTEQDQALAQLLSRELGLSYALCLLLVGRGFRTIEDIQRYLYPKLNYLHDPYLMHGMSSAIERISRALEAHAPIVIYGDYDVDGTTAVSLVYSALRDLFGATELHYYIPNRQDESYGLSPQALTLAQEVGADLMIMLDCGAKFVDGIELLQGAGIDVIVCDHHQPDSVLPNAYAILNPKQPECAYPCSELSGCGVGYKLMQGLALYRGIDPRTLYNYLDLVAISIAADIVPLLDENRIMLYHGIKQLNSHPSVGIRALMQVAGIATKSKDLGSIIYQIAPRLNAAGRLMNGADAVALMVSRSADEARAISLRLDGYNQQRRILDLELTEQAEQEIQRMPWQSKKVLVLYRPDWFKGVLGIVASRLTERYHRPTIILTKSGGVVMGSGRSMRSVDLYSAIEACREHLINFGGHKHATGLTLHEAEIDAFRVALEQYFEHHVEDQDLCPPRCVDLSLRPEDITPQLKQEIALMSPFGLSNEVPLLATYALRDSGGSRIVGKRDQHLNLRMTDVYCRCRPLHGIALGQAMEARTILEQRTFDICYTMEENPYQGAGSLQLSIKAIEIH